MKATRRLAAVTAVACFAVGLATAAADHHARLTVAIAEAQEAAQVLEASRARLEGSLTQAQVAAGAAAPVTTATPVADAVQALDASVTVADTAAARYGVALLDATLRGPTPFTRTPPLAPVPPLTRDDARFGFSSATPSAVASAGTDTSSTPSPHPTSTPSPRETPEPTANGAPSPVPVVTPESGPAAERERVLTGEERSVEEVQRAAEDIAQAAQDLEQRADEVEATAETVAEAADAALLAQAVRELEDARARGEAALSEASALDGMVAEDVAAPVLLVTLRRALDGLNQAVEAPVDMTAVTEVDRQARATEAALADVTQAASGVRSSHVAWVSWQNAWVELENQRRIAEYEQALLDAQQAREDAIAEAVEEHVDGWAGEPPDIEGENGLLDPEELCEIAYAPGHLLQCDAAAALEEADAAYFEETGLHLTFTDSYRTYGMQVVTRALKGFLAATPGLSNHGWGMAVDFDPAPAAWLAENGAPYGWIHPSWAQPDGSKPESWHLEFVAPGVAAEVEPPEPVLLTQVESRLPGD